MWESRWTRWQHRCWARKRKFASLELATEYNGELGGVSYKTAETPLPFEPNPRRVFERLFGEGGRIDPAASAERQAADESSLDSVMTRISELKARLGPNDCRKLDEYLQSIRDIERRIQVAMERKPLDLPEMARPAGIPDSWPEHVKIMFDLQALALQADLTRVWTFMMAHEATSMTFPHLGITMGHHEISHHNFEPDKLEALAKINVNQSELFAYFLSKLEGIKEGGSSLLDHSLIMYGSDLSVPTVHSQHNLPIILAGARLRANSGRAPHCLSGGLDPADESLSHHARQDRCTDGKTWRQYRQIKSSGGLVR